MPQPQLPPDAPFQILVVGDFSGRNHGGMRHDGRDGPLGPVRLETVDDLMEHLRPSVQVQPRDGDPVRLAFESMEDFHPDRLIRQVPALDRRLRSVERLVEEALAERVGTDAPRTEGTGDGPGAGERVGPETDGGGRGAKGADPPDGLLDDIVAHTTGERPGAPSREAAPVRELRDWIGQVVAPHLKDAPDPDREVLRERLRADVAERLRGVLHAAPVRHLESLWRSLLFLAATAGGSPDVRILVLDMSRDELEDALLSEEPQRSLLFRSLAEPVPGARHQTPFAAAVVADHFGPEPADVLLLNRLAMLAHEATVPVLAGTRPAALGMAAWTPTEAPSDGDPPDLWTELRATPATRFLALLAPGFLLRLPYGAATDPCESLPLEEAPRPEDGGGSEGSDGGGTAGGGPWLWGHPAFVGAAALTLGYARDNWRLDPSPAREFGTRPIHVDPDGGVRAHPVERVWKVDEVRRIRDRGVVPLVAYRESATFRLPGLGSLSASGSGLAAWWIG